MWESERDTPAAHLVPAEIALKIEAKVRARQRFTAYVVVPMCVACVRVRAASHVRVPAVLRARCLCALSRAQRAADKTSSLYAHLVTPHPPHRFLSLSVISLLHPV